MQILGNLTQILNTMHLDKYFEITNLSIQRIDLNIYIIEPDYCTTLHINYIHIFIFLPAFGANVSVICLQKTMLTACFSLGFYFYIIYLSCLFTLLTALMCYCFDNGMTSCMQQLQVLRKIRFIVGVSTSNTINILMRTNCILILY